MTDYAYASSEVDCETNMYKKVSSTYICKNNNWMFKPNTWYWTLSPRASTSNAYGVWFVFGYDVDGGSAPGAGAVFPTIYLKSNVLIESGNGKEDTPYQLSL